MSSEVACFRPDKSVGVHNLLSSFLLMKLIELLEMRGNNDEHCFALPTDMTKN